MSEVRLLVLGILRMQGRAHGYAVRRQLTDWKVDTWTRVQPGSIYHALKQLAKEGKLRAVGTETSAEGPGRTLYELTEAGETEFAELLEAALGSLDLTQLGAGIAFMQALPRDRAIHVLRAQHGYAKAVVENLQRLMPDFPNRDAPPHMQDLLSLWSGGVAATAGWTAQVIRRLEAGEYVMAGEAARAATR